MADKTIAQLTAALTGDLTGNDFLYMDNDGADRKVSRDVLVPVTQSPTDTTAGRLLKVGDEGPTILTGFGSAATATVTQSPTDTTAGRLIRADHGFTRGNLVGTVSESGGEPTGAVIERGSNSNGEFVRFADGTQICFMHRTASLEELTFSFTYPAEFVGDAQGIFASWGSMNSDQRDVVKSHYTRVAGGDIGSTAGELVFQDHAEEVGSTDVALVAHGRWF